ncbi:hypothetical protein RRF57_010067 [Xylaria bambusicola]|uniref:Uncharacterized protein n=1 Tax=Xylaria bambusicola TaxID=326684 RepID=A0AAN7UW25_9PEZI
MGLQNTPAQQRNVSKASSYDWQQQQIALLKASLRAILQDPSITPRDKILLQMRGMDESNCRWGAWIKPRKMPYETFDHLGSRLDFEKLQLCMNKSMALYVFNNKQSYRLGAMDIENWLWRQWFKPYVSDISLNYFSEIFDIKYNPHLAEVAFSTEKLVAFHCNVYEQAQKRLDIWSDTAVSPDEENNESAIYGPLRAEPWLWKVFDYRYPSSFKWEQTFAVRPLYRAVFIALFQDKNVSKTPLEVSEAKVQVVLTGMTEGLSAPISLEELRDEALDESYHTGTTAITTRLGVAVRFIMRLEEREKAANGGFLSPDITKVRAYDWHRRKAKELGWDEERDGNLDDLTPRSCEWVNRDIFKKWAGEGAEETLKFACFGGSVYKPLTRDLEEEDWWWWDRDMLPEMPAERCSLNARIVPLAAVVVLLCAILVPHLAWSTMSY